MKPTVVRGQWHWHKETRTITVEASELPKSSHIGLIMVRGRVETVTYGYVRAIPDSSGEEVGGWEYEPMPAEVTRVPSCRGTKLVVWND